MGRLKSDDYDPSEAVERLVWEARTCVGEPAWRMAGPEIESLIRHEVAEALLRAFGHAEALYINEQIRFANRASCTLLEGVLAGVSLAEGTA